MKTKKINKMRKALGLLFALMLVVNYSCTRNEDDNNDDHFTYTGTIDQWCDYLINIEKNNTDINDNYELVKPINLDSSFEIHKLKVKVTFSYIGEQQTDCGGFVGNPEKIEVIKIEKL